MNARMIRTLVIASAALCFAVPHSAAEDVALKPSWTCLPAETIALVRIPSVSAFLSEFRKQTKLGAVLFGEERMNKALALLKDAMGAEWEVMNQDLGKFGLKFEDWRELLAGETGYAGVQIGRAGDRPLFVGLGWCEPSGDLGARALKALLQGFDESKDKQPGTVRIDAEIHGHTVSRFSIDKNARVEPPLPNPPADFAEKSPDEQRAWFEARKKLKAEQARVVVADRIHLLVARIGQRIVFANTFPQSENTFLPQLAANPDLKIDLDAATGLAPATDVFARFLAAHTAAEPASTGPRAMVAAPIMATLPSAGAPLLECFFDPRPLIDLVDPQDLDTQRGLRIMGVRQLGPIGMRATLDKTLLRFGMTLTLPAPRTGVLALMDQEPLPPEPPPWVEENVASYMHFACDFGKVYSLVKEAFVAEGGAEAAAGFAQFEQGVQGTLQTDFATALSSLGRRHAFVQYTAAKKVVADPENEEFSLDDVMGTFAIVWELKDEEILRRAFQALEPFAQGFPGFVAPVEEQGFKGWRALQGFEAGMFLGQGHLIIAFGKGSAERVLASIRTPPASPASLREGTVLKKARTLLELRPALGFAVTNPASYESDQLAMISSALDLILNQIDEESPEWTARARELLPTVDELRGSMGVSVLQAFANQHGLVIESSNDRPAP